MFHSERIHQYPFLAFGILKVGVCVCVCPRGGGDPASFPKLPTLSVLIYLQQLKDLPFFRALRTRLGRVVPSRVTPLQLTLPSLPAAAEESDKEMKDAWNRKVCNRIV